MLRRIRSHHFLTISSSFIFCLVICPSLLETLNDFSLSLSTHSFSRYYEQNIFSRALEKYEMNLSEEGEPWTEEYEETKNYWALLVLVLCISVVFGNVLVILSVAKEKSLQNITNYFIVSLAVADLCVAGVVMPFYAYTMVRKNFR